MHALTHFVHVHSNFLAERFIMETTRTRMGVQRSAVAFHSEVCRPSHALLVSVSVTHVSRNPSKCTAVCPANLTETVQMNIQRASLRCNSEVCHPLCPKLSPEPARTDGLSPLVFRNPATLHLGIRPHTHTPHITPITHTIAPGCVFNQPLPQVHFQVSTPLCIPIYEGITQVCPATCSALCIPAQPPHTPRHSTMRLLLAPKHAVHTRLMSTAHFITHTRNHLRHKARQRTQGSGLDTVFCIPTHDLATQVCSAACSALYFPALRQPHENQVGPTNDPLIGTAHSRLPLSARKPSVSPTQTLRWYK